MLHEKRRLQTTQLLVTFLSQYSQVLSEQITGVRALIEEAVGQVMTSINDISTATGQEANQAKQVLEDTYFNPDVNTSELVATIQQSVDTLFEQAQQGAHDVVTAESLVDARLRRFGGKFSKHMEALTTLDDDIGKVLMQMVGSLSNDDVIRQKLEHLGAGITALEDTLSYFIADFYPRFTSTEVGNLKMKLLMFTFAQFTCEDEKVLFREVFGDDLTNQVKDLHQQQRKAS